MAEALVLRSAERGLIERIRKAAIQFGTVRLTVDVEFQNGEIVLIRLVGPPVAVEEKLK